MADAIGRPIAAGGRGADGAAAGTGAAACGSTGAATP